MTAASHRIRRLRMRVTARSREEAFVLRPRLRDAISEAVLPSLEQVFDELAPSNEVVRIARLELRATVDEIGALARVLPALVRHELDGALGTVRAAGRAGGASEPHGGFEGWPFGSRETDGAAKQKMMQAEAAGGGTGVGEHGGASSLHASGGRASVASVASALGGGGRAGEAEAAPAVRRGAAGEVSSAREDRTRAIVQYLATGSFPWHVDTEDSIRTLIAVLSIEELARAAIVAATAHASARTTAAVYFRLLQFVPPPRWTAIARAILVAGGESEAAPTITTASAIEVVAALAGTSAVARHVLLRVAAAALVVARGGWERATTARIDPDRMVALLTGVDDATAAYTLVEIDLAHLPPTVAAFFGPLLAPAAADPLGVPVLTIAPPTSAMAPRPPPAAPVFSAAGPASGARNAPVPSLEPPRALPMPTRAPSATDSPGATTTIELPTLEIAPGISPIVSALPAATSASGGRSAPASTPALALTPEPSVSTYAPAGADLPGTMMTTIAPPTAAIVPGAPPAALAIPAAASASSGRSTTMLPPEPPPVSPVAAQIPAAARLPIHEPFGIPARHAGLILLHPFLPRLFEQTRVKQPGRAALDPAALPRAAALLHACATGEDEPFEYDLAFIKILLGRSPEEPLLVAGGLLTDADREEVDGLLRAVIDHWTVLKKTSSHALRSTFLRRGGLVREEAQGIRLQVEPAGFDVLLSHLPWGIATVKLPWVPKAIFTEWQIP